MVGEKSLEFPVYQASQNQLELVVISGQYVVTLGLLAYGEIGVEAVSSDDLKEKNPIINLAL